MQGGPCEVISNGSLSVKSLVFRERRCPKDQLVDGPLLKLQVFKFCAGSQGQEACLHTTCLLACLIMILLYYLGWEKYHPCFNTLLVSTLAFLANRNATLLETVAIPKMHASTTTNTMKNGTSSSSPTPSKIAPKLPKQYRLRSSQKHPSSHPTPGICCLSSHQSPLSFLPRPSRHS